MVLDETFLEFLYRMKKSVNAERNRLALWGPRGKSCHLGGGGAHKSSLTTLIKQHWAQEVLRQGTAWNFRLGTSRSRY